MLNILMMKKNRKSHLECLDSTGFDTISTALSWAVMYLVVYPEIQERLHQELSESASLSYKSYRSDPTYSNVNNSTSILQPIKYHLIEEFIFSFTLFFLQWKKLKWTVLLV